MGGSGRTGELSTTIGASSEPSPLGNEDAGGDGNGAGGELGASESVSSGTGFRSSSCNGLEFSCSKWTGDTGMGVVGGTSSKG